MSEKDFLKTGTTTLALKYNKGIILAADKRATAGYTIVQKDAEKVHLIKDKIALTIAGTVSEIQNMIKLLKAQIKLKELETRRNIIVEEVAGLLSNMTYNTLRTTGGVAHFIVGGIDSTGKKIFDVFPDGSLSEVEDFYTSGSGSSYVLGVLEANYKKDMNEEEALQLAENALKAALERDIGSGNGYKIMVLSEEGETKTIDKKLEKNFN